MKRIQFVSIRNYKSFLGPLLCCFAAGAVAACGLFGSGGTVTINDAAPSGTIIYSGSFASNSNGISGQVYVYVSSGKYTIRLESFSTSGVSGLRVLGNVATGDTPLNSTLKGTDGNQNYTATSSTSGVWTSVQIQNASLSPPDDVLATAVLSSVSSSLEAKATTFRSDIR